MAGTITHYYFARDLYKKLDKNTKKKLKDYQDTMYLFSQGADILFFSISHKVRQLSKDIHQINTKNLFLNMIKYIKENNLENDYELRAFIYGFVAHYALDISIHPYANYKGNKFDKKDKSTYKNKGLHNKLEQYIDAYFINKRENIEAHKYKSYNYLFNYKISKNLSKMIDDVIFDTHNYKHASKAFIHSRFNMKFLYHLMRYDKYKIKYHIYRFIDKITPKYWIRFTPVSYYSPLDNDNYYLNLDHKTWCYPIYRDMKSNKSVLEIYDDALNKAVDMIKTINTFDMYKINEIFLNLSMSNGYPCNNKLIEKYFEENNLFD